MCSSFEIRVTLMVDVEARMLSGEPFTMEELKRRFSKNENEARKIVRTVREFHRLGYIKPERHHLRVIWIATPSGIAMSMTLPAPSSEKLRTR
jgi:hypothetical protein